MRDDQHKPNNDDVTAAVTLPEGTTGKSITKKEVVGNVPTEVGGPTNVVVKVTYGDGSTENVEVPVLVVGLPSKTSAKDKEHLTPEEKKQVEDKVKAKNPGKEVTVGDDGTATVKDPTTGISHTIPGTDLVNQDFEPVKPDEKVPVKDKAHLTPEEKKQVEDKVKAKNPGKEVTVGDDGTVTVTDPTTGISHTIPGIDLTIIVPPVVDIPEYTGPISSNGVDENGNLLNPPVVDIPEFNGGVNGEPEVHEEQEFNGGVNGELPDPVELPKVQLIITKWIDEQGNELKPADAKAPAVLGEANEAFEAGEIEGYVFVRTKTKGDVVTHIFRKVTPTKPEGNGEQQGGNNKPQSTPEVPTDHTERKPEVVTPDEQPAETENTTTKPKASQNILPNTGTANGLGIFSAAAASILAGLGLIIPVKKEDEEEEETQNN